MAKNHNWMPGAAVKKYAWQIAMILDREKGARDLPESETTPEVRLRAFTHVCELVDQKSR